MLNLFRLQQKSTQELIHNIFKVAELYCGTVEFLIIDIDGAEEIARIREVSFACRKGSPGERIPVLHVGCV